MKKTTLIYAFVQLTIGFRSERTTGQHGDQTKDHQSVSLGDGTEMFAHSEPIFNQAASCFANVTERFDLEIFPNENIIKNHSSPKEE